LKKRLIAYVLTLALTVISLAFPISAAKEDREESPPDLYITVDEGYSYSTIYNDKDAKIRTHVSIEGTEGGEYDIDEAPAELKTRGNSTFMYRKKPYQIKFDKKTDLFGMGKAKKWILLANFVDGSFVRNKIVFDLAERIGMPYTPESVFVNVYIDGEYVGLYQLCEKIEIGDSRVPLESEYGVIAEMDAPERYAQEDFWFRTSVTGKPFVYKEYNTDFEDEECVEETRRVRAYFESRINALEDEIYNNGKDWALVESLIDVDSFVRYYFINELCENTDVTYSSTYFYTDGPGDVIHAGPVWDYDRCFGSYADNPNYDQSTDADYLKNVVDATNNGRVDWYKMLCKYPQFVKRLNEMYDECIKEAFNADDICSSVDEYLSFLMPSLVKNHKIGYPVFYTASTFVKDYGIQGGSAVYVSYTAEAVKTFIRERIAYLDRAYGRYAPVLSYSTGGAVYTGGCITDVRDGLFRLSVKSASVFDGGVAYSSYRDGELLRTATDGDELSLEGADCVSVGLYGNLSDYYEVQFRVTRNKTEGEWLCGGQTARLSDHANDRIQIRLLEKKEAEFGRVNFELSGCESIDSAVGNSIDLKTVAGEGYIWFDNRWGRGESIAFVTVEREKTVLYPKYAGIDYTIGDANGDGMVNSMDSNYAKRIIVGSIDPDERISAALDVMADGCINAKDTYILLRYLSNKEN